MYRAAKVCGHNYLREGSLKEVDQNKESLTNIEYSRAKHFYQENERVLIAKKALNENDEETFLAQINQSRISSTNYLKNMMVANYYAGSPLEACDIAMEVMENHGACKINGGGFTGSIICIVPNEYLEKYGYNDVEVTTVLHEWMGGFPEDEAKALKAKLEEQGAVVTLK